MCRNNRTIEYKFSAKVPFAYRIDSVIADVHKAQLFSRTFSIQWQGRAGYRSTSQRRDIQDVPAVFQTNKVTLKLLYKTHQIRSNDYRLSTLQMCISRHYILNVF